MGRDALTTGTICIFILFLKYLMDSIQAKRFIREKYDLLIFFLIIAGALSILLPIYSGALEKFYIGAATRGYFEFFSSMLFFMVIKNYQGEKYHFGKNKSIKYSEDLLNLIIILTTIHIIISLSVKHVPSIGSCFNIFLPRNVDVFDSVSRSKMERIGSFVFGPESFGEFIAVLCPIILFKIYKKANILWILCLSLFLFGILLTVTRSGILLFTLAVSITTTYCFKRNLGKSIISLIIILISSLMLMIIYPQIFNSMYARFYDVGATYEYGGTIFEVVNRDKIPDVINMVFNSLTFFGNGITEYNFHNLYLTTIHQKGIIGAVLFFLALLYPVVCLLKAFSNCKASEERTLIFVCLTSFSIFLVNELKYEFIRSASYQQLCWGLFAIFYLISKSKKRTQT
jgi:hypothetical protein